ncbi:MAG: hypothetical protein M5U01_35185 [Ardenticatenaceae bacterium]|nr:hypothetical protein [Ardenticatenaceae bacterium]
MDFRSDGFAVPTAVALSAIDADGAIGGLIARTGSDGFLTRA